jgi:guanylate kinase
MNKLIIFTAPSGAGKTTIVNHLLKQIDSLAFSVSATTRDRRENEIDGESYYFLSPDEFKHKIEEGAFVEWEEVYRDQYYGTLKSEVERLWAADKNIIFDIDVQGAVNIKKHYPDESLAIFVKPPSPEILFSRLKGRKTETPESLKKRIDKASVELGFEDKFDVVLVNDDLEKAIKIAKKLVTDFITHKTDN